MRKYVIVAQMRGDLTERIFDEKAEAIAVADLEFNDMSEGTRARLVDYFVVEAEADENDHVNLMDFDRLRIIKSYINPADIETALEFHRRLKGYTQKKLAELSGVNVRMIQYYEQGAKDINAAAALTVYRLAQALDSTVEDLLEI